MERTVIIVAGGTGERMGTEVPKQFLILNGLPILMHTINLFFRFDSTIEIRIVLPARQIDQWQKLCLEYDFKTDHQIISGGKSRFHSVKNGLAGISNKRLIAIHDGVRPLVSQLTIRRCFETALQRKAAVPVVHLNESIRKLEGEYSRSADRSMYRLVQTPQVFVSDILLEAYQTEYQTLFTDDASVVEKAGYQIFLTEGNTENIKITSPKDLLIAAALMNMDTDA